MAFFKISEIFNNRNYYSGKIVLFLIVLSIIFGVFGIYSVFNSPEVHLNSLQSENKLLKKEINKLVSKYSEMSIRIDNLAATNNDLRLAVNLQPLSDEELQVGVGGGYFDNNIDFLSNNSEEELNKALTYIEEVSRKVEFEKTQFLEISEKLKEHKKLNAAIPAIKPCNGVISDGFGVRIHPILRVRRMHDGLDFIADVGTPVYSTGNGKVIFAGYRGGYGLTIEIDHGFEYRTTYAHLSGIKVKVGQKISRGDLIAKSGNSGLSTGPHLHYEIEHNGVKENPAGFFFDDLGFFELTAKK